VSVPPRSVFLAIFGVKCQAVDVIGACTTRHPDDVVPGQVERLPLHLILQDGVHPPVQQRVLIWIVHGHCPDKPLVHHLDCFWKSNKMAVFKISTLLGVTVWAGLGTSWLSNTWSNAVCFASSILGLGFSIRQLLLFLLMFGWSWLGPARGDDLVYI